MMTTINAIVIADSINEFGNRITTLKVTFPRYILAELNTHRSTSKNSASSRAKPFKTMLRSVLDDPFIPVAWMKDHKGMQGNEFTTDPILVRNYRDTWLYARDAVVQQAQILTGDLAIFDDTDTPYVPLEMNLTKQIVNRILEPFLWHEVLITATEWDNFFTLRCPRYEVKGDGNEHYQSVNQYFSRKDAISVHPELANLTDLEWRMMNVGMADIHIMDLAEAIWDAKNSSTPKELKTGEWHLPYADNLSLDDVKHVLVGSEVLSWETHLMDDRSDEEIFFPYLLMISAARCARISYKTFGEDSKVDLVADVKLHNNLLVSQPIHASPAEHQAQAMGLDDLDDNFLCEDGEVRLGISRNFVGFKQYRTLLKNETIRG